MKKELAGSQSTDWDSSSLGRGPPAEFGGRREGGREGGLTDKRVCASPSPSPVVHVTIPLVNVSLSLTFYCTRPHLGRLSGLLIRRLRLDEVC